MNTIRAALYIVAVILLVLAAFGVDSRRLALLGAACALLAFALPVIHEFHL